MSIKYRKRLPADPLFLSRTTNRKQTLKFLGASFSYRRNGLCRPPSLAEITRGRTQRTGACSRPEFLCCQRAQKDCRIAPGKIETVSGECRRQHRSKRRCC